MSDINVTIVGSTGAQASIINSDTVNVSVGSTASQPVSVTVGTAFQAQVPSLLVEAGANITVTTSSGSFTVVGRDVPVTSVQGRTGAVTLTRADLTAAATSHTHAITDIVGMSSSLVSSVNGRTGSVTLTADDVTAAALSHTHSTSAISGYVAPAVFSVNGKTGTVTIAAVDVTAAASSHKHSVTDIIDFTSQASIYGQVASVNGRTGTVTLTADDLTCASLVHTHSASQVSDFASEAAKYGPVASVNNRTGAVVLTRADFTAASLVHTHSASQISDFAAEAAKYGPVTSVNGRTATVVLSAADVTAASATHAHNYVRALNGLTGTPSVVAGSNVTVTTAAGNIVIEAAAQAAAAGVSSVNGRTGTVTITAVDVSAASSTHAHNYVQALNTLTGTPSIVAGNNVTVTTAAGSITIDSAAGATLANATPQPLGAASAGTSPAAARGDHIHAMPTAAEVGALDDSSAVDGGEYVGAVINPTPSIQVTSQPSSQSVQAGGVNELASVLPAGAWGAVSRANGQWFISGNSQTQADYLAVSSDGVSWTKRFGLPSAGVWSAVQYQNGVYATQSGNTVAYSSNGTSWSASTISTSRGSVFGAAGKFLRGTDSAIYYSTDASAWTQGLSWTTSQNGIYFGYANGIYFAADYSLGVRASTNGTSWGSVAAGSAGIDGTNGRIITPAVLGSGIYLSSNSRRPVKYDTSTDAWTSLSIRSTVLGGGQIASNGSILAFYDYGGSGTGKILTSTNGTSWVERQLPTAIPSGRLGTLFYAGGKFVLILRVAIQNGVALSGQPSTVYFTSTDGITWSQGSRTNATPLTAFNYIDSSQFADQKDGAWSTITFGDATATATFGVSAFYSSGQISYQWQVSTDAGSTWTNVSGATSPTLTLTGLTSADSGKRYRVVLSATGASTVNSNSATLTVT